MRTALERRQALGEIRDNVDVVAIRTAVICQRPLIAKEPLGTNLSEEIVDRLLLPL